MAVTTSEKQLAAYYLGYTSNLIGGGLAFGQATNVQIIFPIWTACDHLIPESEPKFRQLLGILEGLEAKQVEAVDFMVADTVDDVKVRSNYPQILRREYRMWQGRLAALLCVSVNPDSQDGGCNVGRVC